jgi:hypothetical protein
MKMLLIRIQAEFCFKKDLLYIYFIFKQLPDVYRAMLIHLMYI